MTTTAVNSKPAQHRIEKTRTEIVTYLARHGASKVSDITDAVTACKDTVKVRLAELEEEGAVRANVPAGERGRTTPYYSLTSAGLPEETPKSVITVHITSAADGRLTLAIDNYPGLTTTARSFIDIPAAARQAAASHTGDPEDSYTVHIRF